VDSSQDRSLRRYYSIVATVLMIVIVTDLVLIGVRTFSRSNVTVSQVEKGVGAVKLNPNTAEAEDLECVPGIDGKTARAIVDYRDEYRRRFPGRSVFGAISDMRRVKGVTERMLTEASPFLVFGDQK